MSLQTVDRWLSVRLEMLGNFVVLMATLLSVLAASNGKLVAGLAGLSITNALRHAVESQKDKRDTAKAAFFLPSTFRVFGKS